VGGFAGVYFQTGSITCAFKNTFKPGSMFTTLLSAAGGSLASGLAPKPNRVGGTPISNDVTNTTRAGSAAEKSVNPKDVYHSFPDIVDNYAGDAVTTPVANGTKYSLPGSLNGRSGVFEWIIDGAAGAFPGQVSHRMFVPD